MNDISNRAGWKEADFIHSYRQMLRIRQFEEEVFQLYQEGKVHGTLHLCTGQEATAVGSAGLLREKDWITSTHRNHGHCIAKGTDMREMMAEILGRATGTNKGKGGSMHIADLAVGNLGSNGIVGAGFPIAAGAALTAQMEGTDQVVICYSGDGATNEGSFHEALNLASIWHLPVVYFVENNQYGMSSSIQQMINIPRISERAKSYGIPGFTIDGNDFLSVLDTTWEAIEIARSGKGPVLIEALTYRHCGHSKSDSQRAYRSREEEQLWRAQDPIARLEKVLSEAHILLEEQMQDIKQEVTEELQEIVSIVLQDPFPDPMELWTNVYAERERIV